MFPALAVADRDRRERAREVAATSERMLSADRETHLGWRGGPTGTLGEPWRAGRCTFWLCLSAVKLARDWK
jgi:hypothetical protein